LTCSWLFDKMSAFDDREAIISNHGAISYRHLLELVDEWKENIKAFEMKQGEIVLLEGDYSPAVCGAFLALLSNGNVIVPLSSGLRHSREEFMNIAEVNRTIIFEGDQFTIGSHSTEPSNRLMRSFLESGHTGLILFTSGTTGSPKAILHDMSRFLERYRTPRETYRTLTFLLFDHIGGINTLLHTFSNGGVVITPTSRSPAEICALMERHQVELLPASPSFLNLMLITKAYMNYDLSALKIITYGTEVMPDYTLAQMRERFPNVQLRQTYGLSELGILRAKSKDSGSPWLKIGGEGVETKIVDEVLYIRSRTAMVGYLNAANPFDKEGWFNTEDQVAVDGEYMRILGRKSEIINVGGRKVYPIEVEQIMLQMPEVQDVAVKGEPNSLLGQMVTATVNVSIPITPGELKDRIRSFCMDRLEPYQIPVKVYIENRALYSDRYKKMRK
jgi:long-chain acyl-CoA synthetase